MCTTYSALIVYSQCSIEGSLLIDRKAMDKSCVVFCEGIMIMKRPLWGKAWPNILVFIERMLPAWSILQEITLNFWSLISISKCCLTLSSRLSFILSLPFICKGLYHVIANKSRRSLVYHPQPVAVYHQHEVLYLIKPQEDAPSVMIYALRRWYTR